VLNLSSQTATVFGTALTSTVLASFAVLFAPSLGKGGISAAAHLPAPARHAVAPELAHAAQLTLAMTAALMLLALIASRTMPVEVRRAEPNKSDEAWRAVESTSLANEVSGCQE
jgi:hypothetical protein